MSEADPKVSVIIPTYNRAAHIGNAIESVLKQVPPLHEIVVVDDGSTDETPEVLGPLMDRIVFVPQENAGPSAARNRGAQVATGDYLAFLDSDDLWTTDHMARQMPYLPAADEVLFARQRFEAEDEHAQRLQDVNERGPAWPDTDAEGYLLDQVLQLAKGRYLQLNTMLIRKDAFEKIGDFDTELRVGEDEEWFFRAALQLRIRLIDDELAIRKLHDTQTGFGRESSLADLATVFRRIMERAEAAGHHDAAKAARSRWAGCQSWLANIRSKKGDRKGAVSAMWVAIRLEPARLKWSAKLLAVALGSKQVAKS